MTPDYEFAAWLRLEFGVDADFFDPDELAEWYEVYLEEELDGYEFYDW